MHTSKPDPLYIFDLDGTLADAEHRRHFIERKNCPGCLGRGRNILQNNAPAICALCNGAGGKQPDWDAFFAYCNEDTPIQPVVDTLGALIASGAHVYIWSARSASVRERTLVWLCGLEFKGRRLLTYAQADNILRMRPQGDFTPDEKLKQQWLNELSEVNRSRLVAVFDDRQKVVDMWRANGVACFQVAKGDF